MSGMPPEDCPRWPIDPPRDGKNRKVVVGCSALMVAGFGFCWAISSGSSSFQQQLPEDRVALVTGSYRPK